MLTHTLDKLSKRPRAEPRREGDGQVAIVALEDGRQLAYAEYGDRRGFPLFYCHNNGSSRLEGALFDSSARKAGFRLISIDRPGIGFSDFHRDGDPGSFSLDLIALADMLGCRRFGLMACGGGAAFGLAVCSSFPDRAQLMVGLSCEPPRQVPLLSNAASLSSRLAVTFMRISIALRHRLCAGNPLHYLDRLSDTLCFADRKVLQNPRLLGLMAKDMEESMRQGSRGIAHDSRLSYVDWGFEPSAVKVPVHIWQGSADTLVSPRCAELFAERIPGATLHRVANRGHFFFLRCMEEVFSVANAQLHRDSNSRRNLPLSRTKSEHKPRLACAAV